MRGPVRPLLSLLLAWMNCFTAVCADETPTEVRRLSGFVAPVSKMAVSPDGRLLATASNGRSKDGTNFGDARIWDLATGRQLLKVADEPNTGIWTVAFHPSGRRFVTLGQRGNQHVCFLWETETGKRLGDLSTGDVRLTRDLVFLHGGSHVINNSQRRILIADSVTGREVRKFGDVTFSHSLAVSPNERMVASGVESNGANTVQVCDLASGKRLMETGKIHWSEQIQFSSDNRRMMVGSFQSSELWNVEKFDRVAELGNETRGVFSPNGQVLLTANPNCVLSVRDAATGKSQMSFPAGDKFLSALAFLPDGRQVMCAGGLSSDQVVDKPSPAFDIRVWKLPESVAARAASPSESPEPPKLVAPSRDELKQARAEIRKIFESDYSKAKKPEAKGELARTLLEHAAKADSPRDRFAFLEESRELAASGGDVGAATQAIEQLGEFDGADVAAMQVEAARSLAVSVKHPTDLSLLSQFCLDVIEQLIDAESFDAATEVVKAGNAVGVKLKDTALRDKLKLQQDRIIWLKKLTDDAEQARATLTKSPDDSTANDKLGRYLCLARQDWDAGLKHLAAGNDAKWKAAAVADRSVASADAVKQTEAADVWFDLAKTAKSADRPALFGRAKHWYELAAPNATGLAKVRIETRLKEIDKSDAASPPSQPKPKSAPKAKPAARQSQRIREFGGTLTAYLFIDPWDHVVIRGQSAWTTRTAHGWHRGPTDEIHHTRQFDG